ncbi:2TM domain-containing protein [Candidatus Aquiluna sp. UB-MaderosW2red]|uniref:2TM domain-containing protein n=1 Tax=Candidatus Aquiluna sp. UB-MaderosW2red TaxID=1855377 RepID=UPI000875B473|nr:2TM domain-containing protein [Candidatus Aquiluna sp. UB-MaderosW2red]SCX02606.1 2TM domain-containing protein [Candidatus Aquiluna sp. UB-MaderosW2red]
MAQLDSELRAYAKKQLKNKQEFRVYLRVYLAVVALTATIWFLTSPGSYFWPIWVIFGMGIGAVFMGLEAYGKLGNKPIRCRY